MEATRAPRPHAIRREHAKALAAWRWVRKLVVLVIGGTVLLIGVAMIVLPGPAVVVIPAGLGILATEFLWARRLLERAHARLRQTMARAKRGRHPPGKGRRPDSPRPSDTPRPSDSARSSDTAPSD